MKYLSSLTIILAIILVFSACKKEEEENLDAKYQPIGNYGNAELIYSNSFTLNNWTSYYDDGHEFGFTTTASWVSITQSIKDNGLIMAYYQDGSEWYALPNTESGYEEDNGYLYNYSYSINFSIETGYVNFDITGTNNLASPSPSDFNGVVIRVVAVSQKMLNDNPNTNWSDYQEVQKMLYIK